MKKLLILPFILICQFVFGQDALISISQTSPALPARPTACHSVTFHVIATNNLSSTQSLDLDIWIPGITASAMTITAGSTPFTSSSTSIDGFGNTHFLFNFSSVGGHNTREFDISYFLPCSFIPTSSSDIAMGSYDMHLSITSSATGTPPSFSIIVPVTFNWVNLFFVPLLPTANLVTSSHIGATVSRTWRINCGTSSVSIMPFNADFQFVDNRSASCGMGQPLSVTVHIFNHDDSPAPGGGTFSPTTPTSGIFNVTGITINSDQYLSFTEDILIVEDPSLLPDRCLRHCALTSDLRSDISIFWGCAGGIPGSASLCHNIDDVDAQIHYDDAPPLLSVTQLVGPSIPDVICMEGSPSRVLHTKKIQNTGMANAYNIQVNLATQSDVPGVFLPSNEFIFSNEITTTGASATITSTPLSAGDHSTISTCADALTSLARGNPIHDALITIPVLRTGDFIEINYYTYRCCPSDHDALVSNFNDPEYFDIWQLGVTGFTECNSIVAVNYTPSPQNQGARIIDLTQRPLAGPTHLTGGVSPLGCMSSNRHIYQIQNLVFCAEDRRLGLPHYPLNSQFFDPTTSGTVSGTLRVRITTQRGLNVDPFSEVTLQDEIGTTPVHYSTVNSILPYGTGTITEGGQWEFYFSLSALASTLGSSSYDNLKAFMDNSIFNFPLTPCCTGKNVPAYSLEWEINPYNTPDARGCSSCWIPLARSEGSIHLMCPGCVTPGVIVQDVSINRTTAGWPDHDNDGLADAGSVPYTSVSAMHTDPDAYSLAGKSYMPGDELSSDIFAYGVDGDNTNHGFDYATLMAGRSLSTPVDHFDYLNISITDPCMANWTTTNATIEIQFPGASSFVLSSSSLLTYLNLSSSTPTNQIYNIPYSAFPAGSSYTQYHINDEYKVHFDYRVCVNGPAGDCDHQVVMWWSITPHGLSSILSVPQAGIPNEALSPPPLYLPAITPAGRVAALPHDLRYFCEGRGDMIHAYHIKKTYTGAWNDNSEPLLGNLMTCKKRYIGSVNYSLEDAGGSGHNFFIKEYRPINLNFVNEDYIEPPATSPNYLYDHSTITSTLVNTYNSSGAILSHTFAISPAPTESYSTSSSHALFAYLPAPPSFLPLNIAMNGVPFTGLGTRSYSIGANLYKGDESTTLTVEHYYVPTTCPTSPFIYVNTTHDDNFLTAESQLCDPPYVEDEIHKTGNLTYALHKPNPDLDLVLITPPVVIYTFSPTCYKVRLSNPSGTIQVADNAFVYIEAIPDMTITSVTLSPSFLAGSSSSHVTVSPIISGTTISGHEYRIVNIPQLKSGEYCDIEICFHINPCPLIPPLPALPTPLDMPLKFGYSCIGPIATNLDVPLACNLDILHVYATPARVSIAGTGITIDPPTIPRCSTTTITSSYWIAALGMVDHLHLVVILPSGVALSSPAAIITIAGAAGTPIDLMSAPPIVLTSTSDLPSIGYTTYDIALPDGIGLPYGLPDNVMIKFTFTLGFCASGDITPLVQLVGTTYCNDPITFPVAPTPVGVIHVLPGSSPNCIGFTLSSTKTPTACLGAHTGTATVIVTTPAGLPVPAYTYRWSTTPVCTTATATGLGVGHYTVTVTDPTFSCSETLDIEIVGPIVNPIGLPTVVTRPYSTCDVGSLTFTPYTTTGGMANYSYSWTATNVTGVISGVYSTLLPVGSTSYTLALAFTNPAASSIITIRATDNTIPGDPNACYNELTVEIEPCCITSAPMIGSNSTASFYWGIPGGSGTHTETGTSYRVNGTFYIDHDVDLRTVKLFMEPFSKIVVENGYHLTLGNQTVIVACDHMMWEGIVVQNNGVLTVNSARIYDALAAITCDDGGVIHLDEAYFNRNWVDIDVLPRMGTPNPSTIENCFFFCHAELPEYRGISMLPTDGSMWFPHLLEKTTIGINVKNNNLLNIGVPIIDPIWPQTNYFSDMNYGIYSKNSRLTIVNNKFDNILTLTATTGGDGIYFDGSTNLYTYPKALTAYNNRFTNIKHASTYLLGSFVQGTIRNNYMQGKYGILGDDIGLRSTTTCSYALTIWSDTIQFSEGGIQLDRAYRMDLDISHSNSITGTTTIGGTNAYPCIRVAAFSLSSADAPRISIKDNSVFNGRLGIGLINVAPPSTMTGCPVSPANTISGNRVESLDGQPNYVGIGLTTTSNAEITCNSIQGTSGDEVPPASLLQKTGIQLNNNATMNKITCNQMNFLCRGLQFIGPCNMPDRLLGNKFQSLGTHIAGGAGASTTIGNQTGASILPTPLFEANEFDLIPGRVVNNLGATFTLAWKFTPIKFNAPFRGGLTSVGVSYSPSASTLSNFTGCSTCSLPVAMRAGGGGSSSSMSEAEEMAWSLTKTSLDDTYTEDELGMQKISEEGLYDVLKTDSSLLSNDSLSAIYEGLKAANTGKADEIKDLINQQENDEATTKLAVLEYSSDAEDATKQVLEVVNTLDHREDKLLTEDEMNTLQTIAAYCPYRYGQAVYSARILINTQYGHESDYWDDELLCIYGITYRKAHLEELRDSSMAATYIRFYPNPVGNTLTYELSDKLDCKINDAFLILIRDMQGNLAASKSIDTDKKRGTIDLTKLAKGQYIVSVYCGQEVLYLQTITKGN